MTKNGQSFSRRNFLRTAGALMALPWLESLLPKSAFGAEGVKPPVRMGIFTAGGGTNWESWAPKEAGPLGKLPSILRPLEKVKEDILLITNLSHEELNDGCGGHCICNAKHLTAAKFVKRFGGKDFASISMDQVVAQSIGSQTLLPSIEMGRYSYSYSSRDVQLPVEPNPRLVFERMFRGRKPVVPNWKIHQAGRHEQNVVVKSDSSEQSVLDLVNEQAKDLRRGIGKTDQRKLDQYLDSVRSVEKRIEYIESRRHQDLLDLQTPAPSKLHVPEEMMKDRFGEFKLMRLIDEDPDCRAEYTRIMSDLMVLAFQTDTTRVVTMNPGSDDGYWPGVVTVGNEFQLHTLEHLSSAQRVGNLSKFENSDPIAREAIRQVYEWYMGMFSELVVKMKGIDEGGTTLLDNSMLLYTSYMGAETHSSHQVPTLIAGKAGGSLKTGRHVAMPNEAPMANLFVEMINRMGVEVNEFGDSHTSKFAGSLNGRLPGLA